MFIKEIMTLMPACCSPNDDLAYAAKLMLNHNCGAIPVCDGADIVGVITDRDIAIRGFAQAKNPLEITVREVMTHPVFTIGEWEPVEEAIELMERRQLRRVPVVDRNSRVVGILSQADLVNHLTPPKLANLLKGISEEVAVPAP